MKSFFQYLYFLTGDPIRKQTLRLVNHVSFCHIWAHNNRAHFWPDLKDVEQEKALIFLFYFIYIYKKKGR